MEKINLKYFNSKSEKIKYKGLIYTGHSSVNYDQYGIIYSNNKISYRDIKSNPKAFYDSVQSRTDFKSIVVDWVGAERYGLSESYEDFLILMEKRRNINGDDFCIFLRHQPQPHEAEFYYEASMTLVINGTEVDKFYDGIDRIPPLPFEVPEYIQFEGNPGKIVEIAPERDRIDFPIVQHENTKVSRTFISKKCIDKALLYKLYKDPATIGTPKSSRAYTGKVEVVELDMHHIDEQVLEVFIQHGVIRKQEPISETEAEQMIAHAKSEAEKSAQDYKEWLLQQQKS